MQSLLLLGQTRVSDLKAAYEEKIRESTVVAAAGKPDAELLTNGNDSSTAKQSSCPVKSIAHLNSIICRLAEAELVDVVHARSFHSPEDVQKDVQQQVLKATYPDGVKGGKAKIEYEESVAQELRKVRRESKTLKRKLEESGGSMAKRRRLVNGTGVNGTHESHEPESDPVLDVSIAVGDSIYIIAMQMVLTLFSSPGRYYA